MGERLLLGTLAIATGAVVFWYALVHTVHSGTVTVPDVAGLELDVAVRTAHDLGLILDVEEPGAFSDAVPPGLIAAQRPYAGFHLKSGATVTVRLSLGSQRASVPEVRDASLHGALRMIEQQGLRPGLRFEVRGSGRGDNVLATEPAIGSVVAPVTEVHLLVNATPAREVWVMPALLLHDAESVRAFCRQHGLRIGQVHEVDYPGLAAGTVLRQYPAAGSQLSRSDILTLWISG